MQPDIFTERFTVHEVKEVRSRAQAPYMEVSVSQRWRKTVFAYCTLVYYYFW